MFDKQVTVESKEYPPGEYDWQVNHESYLDSDWNEFFNDLLGPGTHTLLVSDHDNGGVRVEIGCFNREEYPDAHYNRGNCKYLCHSAWARIMQVPFVPVIWITVLP